jgi:hypothetical protein
MNNSTIVQEHGKIKHVLFVDFIHVCQLVNILVIEYSRIHVSTPFV